MDIQLTHGFVTVVDDADFEWLSQMKWRVRAKRYTHYAVRDGAWMHRLILNAPAGVDVDHRDGNGLNNRRSNLRLATPVEQRRNTKRRSDNTSGFKGVIKQGDAWRARINIGNGRCLHLGYFSTAEEAGRAYDAAAREHFGEFARTNL